MCETMKFLTSSSSSTIDIPVDYIYSESSKNANQVYFVNTDNSSPCKNCPNNPAVNKFATGICHCILNSPSIT